jgi:hypothetical protein
MTPYEVVYSIPPSRLPSYVSETTRVEAMDEVLRNREQILRLLQHNIKHAQQRMKSMRIYIDQRENLESVKKFTCDSSPIDRPQWLTDMPCSSHRGFIGHSEWSAEWEKWRTSSICHRKPASTWRSTSPNSSSNWELPL